MLTTGCKGCYNVDNNQHRTRLTKHMLGNYDDIVLIKSLMNVYIPYSTFDFKDEYIGIIEYRQIGGEYLVQKSNF